MFGYVITNNESLGKDRQARFRAFYCGLCKRLRAEYGLKGGVVLSFDMTFLALLLNALYEPGETSGQERCALHPIQLHDYISSPAIDYAADINIALAYHKCLDDWQDDRSVISYAEAQLLKRAYHRVESRCPEQCAAIVQWLDEIHAIESSGAEAIDPPVNATGKALATLFAWRPQDVWADALREIGNGLGRFIYLMDAYDDLPADEKRGRYNPLKAYRAREDYEAFCKAALTLSVADATNAFELLPIVQDADILRNILYSGIWSKYVLIRKKRDAKMKERDHAGSL